MNYLIPDIDGKPVELSPGIPEDFVLDDDSPLEILTRKGKMIVTIRPFSRGIMIANGVNRHTVSGLNIFSIGINSLGENFFGESGRYVSGNHVEIAITKILGNSVTVRLTDLNSSNGTLCVQTRDSSTEHEDETTSPVNESIEESRRLIRGAASPEYSPGVAIIVAGGNEGESISGNGKNKAITVAGSRDNNEDGSLVTDKAIAVADGMGGYEAGEEASRIALETVGKFINHDRHNLKEIFYAACNRIANAGLGNRCGTTLAIARKTVSQNGMTRFEVAHVGDTKILAFSRKFGKLLYESRDQSKVQRMIEKKILQPIDRYIHPEKSTITNAVEAKGLVHPPAYHTIEGETDDVVVVICSDGVSDYVTPEEVMELYLDLRDKSPAEAKALFHKKLADLAVGRQKREDGFDIKLGGNNQHIKIAGDGGDNVTVAVME